MNLKLKWKWLVKTLHFRNRERAKDIKSYQFSKYCFSLVRVCCSTVLEKGAYCQAQNFHVKFINSVFSLRKQREITIAMIYIPEMLVLFIVSLFRYLQFNLECGQISDKNQKWCGNGEIYKIWRSDVLS